MRHSRQTALYRGALALLLSLFCALAIMGCDKKSKDPVIEYGKTQCAACGMKINDGATAVLMDLPGAKGYGSIKVGDKTYVVFDDLGCFVKYTYERGILLGEIEKRDVLFTSPKHKGYIALKDAAFTGGNTTPMGSGFLAYPKSAKLKDPMSFKEVYTSLVSLLKESIEAKGGDASAGQTTTTMGHSDMKDMDGKSTAPTAKEMGVEAPKSATAPASTTTPASPDAPAATEAPKSATAPAATTPASPDAPAKADAPAATTPASPDAPKAADAPAKADTPSEPIKL